MRPGVVLNTRHNKFCSAERVQQVCVVFSSGFIKERTEVNSKDSLLKDNLS